MLVATVALLFAAQFSSKDVTFKGVGGLELNGTLVTPLHAKNAPALVLLPGSGPTDRDGNTFLLSVKVDILKQIAEHLAGEGIASFRFDKRAIATYQSKWPKDTLQMENFFSWDNFIGDATAACNFLKGQPGVNPKRVGVLGHSEGALIALKVASNPANGVNYLVMLDGPGRPLDEVIMQQLNEKLPQQLPAAQVPTYIDYSKRAIAQIKKNATVPPNPPMGLGSLFNTSALVFLQQNFREVPANLAHTFKGDALVMNGALDNQVSPTLDAKPLDKALKSRRSGTSVLVIVPGASHCLKATPNRETDVMGGPVVPGAMNEIMSWCKAHMMGKA